jgi:hypothetical protein
LFPANAVHQETADNAAGEVEAVNYRAIANVLREGIIRIKLRNDGGGEDAKRICDEIVAEPSKSCAELLE